mmetsp:Transcript_6919/g.7964  ORF Transcript_6919/g.7964 Transcript_6919/m.7964 type:complete len:410 (-) Transcript_6919:37-1266(-)
MFRRKQNAATGSIRELHKQEIKEEDEIASVVVTISESGSYDELFKKVPQESELGKIVVYHVSTGTILDNLLTVLRDGTISERDCSDEKQREVLLRLQEQCEEAGHDAVCFNFECCGGYSASGFHTCKHSHLELTSFLVKEYGCLTMFSDFSLMALIKDWDSKKLGPNPFAQIGTFSGSFRIGFDPSILKASASAQLEAVGELCDDGDGKGTATVEALSGTILYTITKQASENADLCLNAQEAKVKKKLPYEVQVLSVAEMVCSEGFTETKIEETRQKKDLSILSTAGFRGLAGHVAITYPPSERSIAAANEANAALEEGEEPEEPVRGVILASCGHWIELMKVDASMDRLLKVAGEEYGVNSPRWQQMKNELETCDEEERSDRMQEYSKQWIQTRAPASYNKKLKFRKG